MGIVVPDIFRAQVVWPHHSQIERHALVNTFHFRNDSVAGVPNIHNSIRDLLKEFFTSTGTGISAALRITAFMSDAYKRPQIRIYDMGQPEPREPVIREWDAGAGMAPTANGADCMPPEVAVVVSWRTAVIPPKIGKIGKRGRGRTYISALAPNAKAYNATTGFMTVAAGLRHLLATRGQILAGASQPPNANMPQLVVLSTTYAESDEVTGGQVDDAFDTMRRRGYDTTARTPFTAGQAVP